VSNAMVAVSAILTGASFALRAFQKWQAKRQLVRGVSKAFGGKYGGLIKAGLGIAGLVGGGLAVRRVRRRRRRRRRTTKKRTYRRRRTSREKFFEELKEILMIKMLMKD